MRGKVQKRSPRGQEHNTYRSILPLKSKRDVPASTVLGRKPPHEMREEDPKVTEVNAGSERSAKSGNINQKVYCVLDFTVVVGILMPSVSIIARKMVGVDPNLSFVDWLILLWLYSNPSDSGKRVLASLQKALRRIPDFQKPDGETIFNEAQFEQLILASLKKLKERGLIKIFSANQNVIIELTFEGTNFLGNNLSVSDKNFLKEYGMLR